jgi:hypothetical protein
MGRQKKEYPIVVYTDETAENKIRLKKEIGKAYCDFIIEYISKLSLNNKQMQSIYTRIVNEMIKNRKSNQE